MSRSVSSLTDALSQPPRGSRSDRRKSAAATDAMEIDTDTAIAIQDALTERNPTRTSRRPAAAAISAGAQPAAPAASSTSAKENSSGAPKKKSRSRILEDEAGQECQAAAFKAIMTDEDPYELQRILRPSVAERYPRDMWLSQWQDIMAEVTR
jgi:hypothetical protein